MVFSFMEKFMDTCSQFFGDFTEINVKNNFALIYELLDEVRSALRTTHFARSPTPNETAWLPSRHACNLTWRVCCLMPPTSPVLLRLLLT